jgi:hypothetical protein
VPVVAIGSGARRPHDSVLDSPLTQTGVLIGTPAYMAPEQFAGATPDPKSDQFAFCVTAWQALTGERPFRGESLTQIEAAARAGAGKLDADLDPAIRRVLERGLDSQPSARYPDMSALLEAFAAAARTAPKKRRWLIPVLAGSVLLGGGIVIAIAASQQNRQVEEDCIDPDEAFARIWGDDKRAGLTGAQGIGMMAIIDETRRRWTKSYAAACAGDRTEEKQRRIHCLLDARDSMADTMARMRREQQFDWKQLGTLPAAILVCDPDAFSRDDDPDPDIELDVVPPVPPTPPAPVPRP